MRAFIAITFPPDVRAALAGLQQELSAAGADVKWVEPANLHLTLKFLGEIGEPQQAPLAIRMDEFASREPRFAMSLREVGAFPSLAAPRVVWVGVEQGARAALRLAAAAERAGQEIGVAAEPRPFAAHITIGRVRSPRGRRELAQRLQDTRWRPPAAWEVSRVTLYQSVLGSGGPSYTVRHESPLGSQ